MSARRSVPTVITEKFGGRADMLGYYRYRNPKPGVRKCEVTGWTRRNLGGYKAVLPFIKAVDEIYNTALPAARAKQMEYVNTIPARWRIGQTAFTTLYALKNAPTATHTDDFDYPEGFGVMTSLGRFRGGWLCFPRFRLAIDYQPGDLVLADVHQLHANFPIYEEDFRVACVFFCRKGQHECPA